MAGSAREQSQPRFLRNAQRLISHYLLAQDNDAVRKTKGGKKYTPKARLIALAIAYHCKDDDSGKPVACPGIRRLAHFSGYTTNTVQAALDEICADEQGKTEGGLPPIFSRSKAPIVRAGYVEGNRHARNWTYTLLLTDENVPRPGSRGRRTAKAAPTAGSALVSLVPASVIQTAQQKATQAPASIGAPEQQPLQAPAITSVFASMPLIISVTPRALSDRYAVYDITDSNGEVYVTYSAKLRAERRS
jgi:hypothetical protein